MTKKNGSAMKRCSAGRKVALVLRLLPGESLAEVSREIGQPASRSSPWLPWEKSKEWKLLEKES
jgi:hypothetical protein